MMLCWQQLQILWNNLVPQQFDQQLQMLLEPVPLKYAEAFLSSQYLPRKNEIESNIQSHVSIPRGKRTSCVLDLPLP